MTTNTIHCKVLAKEQDMGYYTLVFKNLDSAPFGQNYQMITVFPNWESRIPDVGEIGFVTYDQVEAGIDKYFDRLDSTFKVYNYSNLIFIKFIKEADNSKKDIIL